MKFSNSCCLKAVKSININTSNRSIIKLIRHVFGILTHRNELRNKTHTTNRQKKFVERTMNLCNDKILRSIEAVDSQTHKHQPESNPRPSHSKPARAIVARSLSTAAGGHKRPTRGGVTNAQRQTESSKSRSMREQNSAFLCCRRKSTW